MNIISLINTLSIFIMFILLINLIYFLRNKNKKMIILTILFCIIAVIIFSFYKNSFLFKYKPIIHLNGTLISKDNSYINLLSYL